MLLVYLNDHFIKIGGGPSLSTCIHNVYIKSTTKKKKKKTTQENDFHFLYFTPLHFTSFSPQITLPLNFPNHQKDL